MTRDEFKKLYPDVEGSEVSPEEFHKPIVLTDPADLIPKDSSGAWLIQNEDQSPQWDPKIKETIDAAFSEGFDAAIDMVKSVFDNSPEKEAEALWEEIEESYDLYMTGD